ncbi:hypothetical protein HDA30_001767 [Micrococcus cohnii]|uniref:Uncharacterized protein n=1 Tax=Micrococcus cohnii TaxID=993416 RepID=A0A7W7GQ61_9MICC|nr:hypothetical protein [Micrococcus cohnii]
MEEAGAFPERRFSVADCAGVGVDVSLACSASAASVTTAEAAGAWVESVSAVL